jgi:hypothetical protein
LPIADAGNGSTGGDDQEDSSEFRDHIA